MENEISCTMMELGRKYSNQAAEATSAKSAKTSFGLAERAFRLALSARKVVRQGLLIDFNLAFLSTIIEMQPRAELWVQYNAFCLDNDSMPIRKGEFFQKLSHFGFKSSKKNGDYYIKPPRRTPQLLIEAGRKLNNPEGQN
jgi:hypothetical protein